MDSELLKLHGIVQKVKDKRKVGEQYMTLQEYMDCEIKRGIEQGIAEAVDAAVAEAVDAAVAENLVTSLHELNIPEDKIVEQLMQRCNLTEEKAKSYLN